MADLSMFANPDDTRQYERGHVFFSLGEPGDVMYVVVSGEVEIAIKDKVVEVVGPGGVFGEMARIRRKSSFVFESLSSFFATAFQSSRIAS